MPSESTHTRRVDLRTLAPFARELVGAVRTAVGEANLLPGLRDGVHAECPACHLRLFGEDVLALSAEETIDPAVSAKLHRLAQGFCGRQGCDGLYYDFTFDPVSGLDWAKVLNDLDARSGDAFVPPMDAAEATAATAAAAKQRRIKRVLLGAGVVVLLLLVRHWLTGGSIPFIHEPRRFQAQPGSVAPLGETNAPASGPPTTNRTFRAEP